MFNQDMNFALGKDPAKLYHIFGMFDTKENGVLSMDEFGILLEHFHAILHEHGHEFAAGSKASPDAQQVQVS